MRAKQERRHRAANDLFFRRLPQRLLNERLDHLAGNFVFRMESEQRRAHLPGMPNSQCARINFAASAAEFTRADTLKPEERE